MLLQPGVLSIGWGRWCARSPPDSAWNSTVWRRSTSVNRPPRNARHRLRPYRRGHRRGVAVRDRPVDGAPAVVLEHITRPGDDLCPDWPQPAQRAATTASRSPAVSPRPGPVPVEPQRRPQPRRGVGDRHAGGQRHPGRHRRRTRHGTTLKLPSCDRDRLVRRPLRPWLPLDMRAP